LVFCVTPISACFCASFGQLTLRRFLLRDFLRRLVLGVLRVAHRIRDLRATEVHEVLRLVLDALDLEGVEMQPELVEHLARGLQQLVRELDAVFVHLLGGELRDHVAERAFEGLFRGETNGLGRQSEEALDGVVHIAWIARDLHVGDRVHIQRNPTVREHLRHHQLDRDDPDVHAVHGLHEPARANETRTGSPCSSTGRRTRACASCPTPPAARSDDRCRESCGASR